MFDIEKIKKSVLNGNVKDLLKKIPDNSLDTVITSPPYFGLRDYGTFASVWDGENDCEHEWIDIKRVSSGGKGYKQDTSKGSWFSRTIQYCSKCGAYNGELGLEPFFGDKVIEVNGKRIVFKGFISHFCDILDGVKRVLKPTGSCFLNIGDSYYTENKKETDIEDAFKKKGIDYKILSKNQELRNKSLCMIPQRIAMEMMDRGWILRNHIIWKKINAFPSGVTDRFNVDYEDVFFFTKEENYYFERQFENVAVIKEDNVVFEDLDDEKENDVSRRIKRCVWSIPTQPFSAKRVGIKWADHFAAFPTSLVELPLKAACPKEVCKKCKTPRIPIMDGENITGYTECSCNEGFEPGIVCDIFMGTGTTAVVAQNLGLNWIGTELNKDFCALIKRRLEVDANYFGTKIIDINGENLKDDKSCEDCGKDDCLLKTLGESCSDWEPKK